MTAIGAKKMGAKEDSPSQSGFSKVFDYVGDIKVELKKVTWTSQEELRAYTKIVVAATFVFAMGTFATDVFIQSILTGLNNVVRLITG